MLDFVLKRRLANFFLSFFFWYQLKKVDKQHRKHWLGMLFINTSAFFSLLLLFFTPSRRCGAYACVCICICICVYVLKSGLVAVRAWASCSQMWCVLRDRCVKKQARKHVNKYRTIFSRFWLAADLGLVSLLFILTCDVVNEHAGIHLMRFVIVAFVALKIPVWSSEFESSYRNMSWSFINANKR